jgi:hypothetical protein
MMRAFIPPQMTNRGFLRHFSDAVKLAASGEHTVTWNRFRDHVVVTVGGWAITTDFDGLETLKKAVKEGKAKRRRSRHDSQGIISRLRKRMSLIKP